MAKTPKKLPKKSIKLDSAIKKPKTSHLTLNKRFREIGEKLADLPVGTELPELKAGKGYRADKLEKVLSDETLAKAAPDFGRAFRDVHPGQDEIVSTASFRELSRGLLLDKTKMPTAKRKQVVKSLDEVSKLRLPTSSSGMATKERTFQHPTNEEEAVFATNAGSGSTHAQLDLRRRAEVADGMEAALAKPGATINSVLGEGIKSGVAFELNEFTGPASSSSMDGRTRTKAVKRRREQTEEREHLKGIGVAYGATQEAGDTDMTRSYRPRSERALSPRRFDSLGETETVSLLAPPKPATASLGAGKPKSSLLDADAEASAGAKAGKGMKGAKAAEPMFI